MVQFLFFDVLKEPICDMIGGTVLEILMRLLRQTVVNGQGRILCVIVHVHSHLLYDLLFESSP